MKEKGSFSSGSADLQPGFDLVLQDVRDVLAGIKGRIVVEGHTDNIAISTSRFRSNWELSAARAVTVAGELLSAGVLDPQRFTVSGFSYTQPLVDNGTAENRALNRRVEIIVNQAFDEATQATIDGLEEASPADFQKIEDELTPTFDISPAEIF